MRDDRSPRSHQTLRLNARGRRPGALICLSLFLQQSRHESALSTGLLILPMSVAVGAGSLVSGPLCGRPPALVLLRGTHNPGGPHGRHVPNIPAKVAIQQASAA